LFTGDRSSIGTVPGILHSIPTGDQPPICTRQWRLPAAAKEAIHEECVRMLSADVIEPSVSPWLSPVVLVRKRDGTIRFCVDFRELNKITTGDTYPLPRIEELLDTLGRSEFFTVLDARSAYWSVPLNPNDRAKTAFTDGTHLYQFKRMPYGLKTAPATFQRMINLILTPVLGRHSLAYLDDFVIHSASFDEHLQHVDVTLNLLSDAGFKLNPSKCEFAKSSFKFLGFKVSAEGIAPDPEEVQAIDSMLIPRNVCEVRRFLGAAVFFSETHTWICSHCCSLNRSYTERCDL